jgi:hypothetical protein
LRDLRLPALYRGHSLFTIEENLKEAREIRMNSGRIISATSAIEGVIAEIISNTIFEEVSKHRELVLGSVLNSDWCSFAAKRKLLKIAVETFRLLESKNMNKLDKSLQQVMSYRNAFAHGTLGQNPNNLTQELHFFEGTPKIAELDDKYFENLKKVFLEAWDTLSDVQQKTLVI